MKKFSGSMRKADAKQSELIWAATALRYELARRSLLQHVFLTRQGYKVSSTGFHATAAKVLQAFADGRVQNLIFTAPFQHGKSELSSRQLPAYLLGRRTSCKLTIASCTADVAKGFARDVKRIMRRPQYQGLWPHAARVEDAKDTEGFTDVGEGGFLYAVGVGGTLISKTVDVIVYDDLYKSHEEANSPTVREKTWEWFNTSAQSRLHNGSQQLMATTRWHSDDIVGRLQVAGLVHEIAPGDDVPELPYGHWLMVNFQAINDAGEPLYPERHSLENLRTKQALDPFGFECSYQGRPGSSEGRLYGEFATYKELPIGQRRAVLDVKGKGTDMFAAGFFVDYQGRAYLTDVIYTDDDAGKTETAVADVARLRDTAQIRLESNGGGEYFARNLRTLLRSLGHTARVADVHQRTNKEAKIITNAPRVTEVIVMPEDWRFRWPKFYHDVTTFKRAFAANDHDDAPDMLTEIALEFIIKRRAGGGRTL